MVSATQIAALALAATSIHTTEAFTTCRGNAIGQQSTPLGMSSDDASAQALSDYMAKSHEEKLKAIKDVEDKKNSEIDVREPALICCC